MIVKVISGSSALGLSGATPTCILETFPTSEKMLWGKNRQNLPYFDVFGPLRKYFFLSKVQSLKCFEWWLRLLIIALHNNYKTELAISTSNSDKKRF
jgi:hypothetical protein